MEKEFLSRSSYVGTEHVLKKRQLKQFRLSYFEDNKFSFVYSAITSTLGIK